jgi:hypothetical protein
MVIAGSFTSYNGINANRICRILNDGGIDSGFTIGTAVNNQIYALQQDQKIIVVGNFTLYNGL